MFILSQLSHCVEYLIFYISELSEILQYLYLYLRHLTLFILSTLAQWSSRQRQASVCPLDAAQCNAVHPDWSARWTLPSCSNMIARQLGRERIGRLYHTGLVTETTDKTPRSLLTASYSEMIGGQVVVGVGW